MLLAGLLLAALAIFGGETEATRRRHVLEHEALQSAQAEAHVIEQLVRRRLEAIDLLHRLTQFWFIMRTQGNEPAARMMADELARTANSSSFGIIQVAAIDRGGWLIWSSVPGSAGPVYLGDREHFRVHRDGLTGLAFSRPVIGRVSGRQTMQITRPLHPPGSSDFAGAAVVSLDLPNFSSALGEIRPVDSDEAMVVGEADSIIADSSRPGIIGRNLEADDPLRAAVAGSHAGAILRPWPDGRLAATGWTRLEGTPLVAVYAVDPDDMDQNAAGARKVLRLGAGAVALVAISVAVLVVLLGERRRTARAMAIALREQEVRESAWRQLTRYISTMPGLIYAGHADLDGRLHFAEVSDNILRVTGWNGLDFTHAQDWESHMHPEDAPLRADFFRALLQDGEALQEYRFRHHDEHWMGFRERARVIGSSPDGSREIVGYVADITVEQTLRARMRTAERLAALGEMATGLAHEINQPLGIIALAADNAIRAIERRGAEAIPELRTRLERIASQSERARKVVEQVRVFGRYDAGKPVPTDLARVVEGVRVLADPALQKSGILLELDMPADLPPVLAEQTALEQVLVNLLLNARDAILSREATEGAPPASGRICLAASREREANVRITVADNGGGIPEEVLPRIFEPFFTTKPVGKGTGLGLSISLTTLRAFGGDLQAANGAEGAVFTLMVPMAPPGDARET